MSCRTPFQFHKARKRRKALLPCRSMETLQNNHRYTPLSTDCLEIRVLRLLPDINPDGPICGELWHINLESDWHPTYDALSYTWGETSIVSAQSIEIDGNKNFLVTPNACQALKDIRLFDRPFLIWVDAICIDQENLIERSAQVHIMSKIYSNADTVRTWLECEISEETGFLDIFESSDLDDLTNLDKDSHTRGILSEVSAILERITALPYWTRIWIQQEVRRARVHDGEYKGIFAHEIHFRREAVESWQLGMYLRYAPSILREAGIELNYRTDPVFIINLLQGDHRTQKNHMHGNLLEALAFASAARLQAANPKDFVYGLLGAVDDHRMSELLVDYAATVSQTFVKAAIYIVQRHRSVDFLTHAQAHAVNSIMPDLPTWVPRWYDLGESVRGRYSFEDEAPAEAAAEVLVNAQWPRVSSCDKYLHVQGRHLGTIRCFFQPCISSCATDTWRIFHKHLINLGFDFRAIFEAFREFGTEWAGAYSLPEMGRHITGRNLTDHNSLLDLAKSLVDEDVSITTTNIPSNVHESFARLQRDFNKECERKMWVVTREQDLGLAAVLPGLVRPGDEIWAIERCTMFIVLRPQGKHTRHYRVLGSARISRFYAPLNPEWTGSGIFAALEHKGRAVDIHELTLE